MSSSEILWQEIAAAAVLGTQRRAFSAPAMDGLFGQLLSRVENCQVRPSDTTGASQLLAAAAVTAVYRKAGYLPAPAAVNFPQACPVDEWQRCSPQAGRILVEILNSGNHRLLAEWLDAAAQSKRRIREEHIALLLDRPRLVLSLRAAVLPVLGQRGRWLAELNPRWRSLVLLPDETAWEEGARAERLAFLAALRTEDPGLARDLLVETWSKETPADKAVFLGLLAVGLSMEDEPFLEATLDDRRKEVRQAAARLLARLPQSRYARRMYERSRCCLIWHKSLVRRGLEVSLPGQPDEAALRDGLEARPAAGSSPGVRARRLEQLVGSAPPGLWSEAWKRRPDQILEAAGKTEWEDVLVTGWTHAALACQDQTWLEALLNYEMRRGRIQNAVEVFSGCPAALQEQWLLHLFEENSPPLWHDRPPAVFLLACRYPWGRLLTEAVLRSICRALGQVDYPYWRWEPVLQEAALRFHPSLLETALAQISRASPGARSRDPGVRGLCETLRLRLDIHQAFLDHSS